MIRLRSFGIRLLYRTVACLAVFIIVIIALSLVPYACSPVYDFPTAKPFHGDSLFNPYAHHDSDSKWLKANFHAHSRAWSGITHGRSSLQEVSTSYRQLDYDIAAVSNYHRMDTLPDFVQTETGTPIWISSYEHGYGVRKNHQICLGSQEIVWLDFVFGQGIHHKQYMIQRLKEVTPIVILAHPQWLNAYTPESLVHLTGYDCLEVFNHFRESLTLWDAALSSGHATWAVGDDDSHDAMGVGENGVCWTMISAPTTGTNEILSALHEGRCYAVKLNSVLHDRWRGVTDSLLQNSGASGGILLDSCQNAWNDCHLLYLNVHKDSITVCMDTNAVVIRFIGQNGNVRKTVLNNNIAGYRLLPHDSYIRIEIISLNTTIALNPVFRITRNSIRNNYVITSVAYPNITLSVLSTLVWCIGYIGLSWLIWRMIVVIVRIPINNVPDKSNAA
jgi:hypothetical protein